MASLIDLHTHTSFSSPCSRMTAEELIKAAIDARLDGVAVTEHSFIEGARVAQEVARRKNEFPVFCGVEVKATIFGDVLVFGYGGDLEYGIDWLVLRATVTAAGGVLIPAHPFRHWDRFALWHHLEKKRLFSPGALALDGRLARNSIFRGLTAIEVENGGCRPKDNAQAAELARLLALPGIGGSDAHWPERVGKAATWFPGKIRTDAELLAALKRGGYHAITR